MNIDPPMIAIFCRQDNRGQLVVGEKKKRPPPSPPSNLAARSTDAAERQNGLKV